MPQPADLTTPRLVLRQWRQSDLAPFAAMNADADVMRYYPATWTREQSNAFAERVIRLIDERGWGFWAVEERASGQFIGFVGLHVPSNDLPFAPCVEVGWRLAKQAWGQGYATEAARENQKGQTPLIFHMGNLRSRAVMEWLGMQITSELDHPPIPVESGLRRYVPC